MAERRFRNLNASVLRHINEALEDDPAADIEAVLNKLYSGYGELRSSIALRHAKKLKGTCKQ